MSIASPQSFHYRIHGNMNPKAYPTVFLHGLMGFAANWGKIWPKFESDRACLVLDQRGHGRSIKPAQGYDPSDYAGDLLNILNHLGWKKAHIVGHSMGGRVALRFCKLYPEYCASLTMEDSGAEANPQRIDWIRGLLNSIPTPFQSREEAKAFFLQAFSSDSMTGGFLHANLEAKEGGLLDWRFHAPGMIETVERGRASNAMDELKSTQIPTLIIRGGSSKEFPAEEANKMVSCRSGITLETIAGAGHFVHAEKPEEFSAVLNKFLKENDINEAP